MVVNNGTLKDNEIEALSLTTTEWKTALELKANEIPLISLAKKGMVHMQVDWIQIGTSNVKVRKFKVVERIAA